jgi:hypothetical protein
MMLKAVFSWRVFATWLLCAFILSAALDKVPDPPALRPGRKEAKAIRLDHHAGVSPHQAGKSFYSVPDVLLPVRWFDFGEVIGTGHPTPAVTLVRHAADSSPPFPVA